MGKLKFLWLQPNNISSRLAIVHQPQTTGLLEALTCRHSILYYRTWPNVHTGSCLPYCYIRFRVAGKGSQPDGQKILFKRRCKYYRITLKLLKNNSFLI